MNRAIILPCTAIITVLGITNIAIALATHKETARLEEIHQEQQQYASLLVYANHERSNGTIWIGSSGSNDTITVLGPPRQRQPENSYYHQVVNKYFDRDGNEIQTTSSTHVVDPNYCRPGYEPNNPIVAMDDGEGNVKFHPQQAAEQPRQTINLSTSAVNYLR